MLPNLPEQTFNLEWLSTAFSCTRDIFQNAPQRNIREASTNPHWSGKSLVIRLMTSRSHAWAGWLSSRRSQIMAASIGLSERDSRSKTRGADLVMAFAPFIGSTDTRSDLA